MDNSTKKPSHTVPNYEPRDEIEEAIFSLARKGLVVDSGHRRWSQRTGRYEIVWVSSQGRTTH
jgi:hypothetical protein